MIEFTNAFKTSDGNVHTTLEEAQRHELTDLFAANTSNLDRKVLIDLSDLLVRSKDKIIDILTTTKSQPTESAQNSRRKEGEKD